jgi:hypothetical protein
VYASGIVTMHNTAMLAVFCTVIVCDRDAPSYNEKCPVTCGSFDNDINELVRIQQYLHGNLVFQPRVLWCAGKADGYRSDCFWG